MRKLLEIRHHQRRELVVEEQARGGRGGFAGLASRKAMQQQRLYSCSGVPLPIPLNAWLISHAKGVLYMETRMNFHCDSSISHGYERES